jgi:hypothetical protein
MDVPVGELDEWSGVACEAIEGLVKAHELRVTQLVRGVSGHFDPAIGGQNRSGHLVFVSSEFIPKQIPDLALSGRDWLVLKCTVTQELGA